MTVDEVLNEFGNWLSGAAALTDVGPVEVVILFGSSVPLLSFRAWQARSLVLIVPADFHVGVASG